MGGAKGVYGMFSKGISIVKQRIYPGGRGMIRMIMGQEVLSGYWEIYECGSAGRNETLAIALFVL